MPIDKDFHIDAATRARIAPEFDVLALERLLQHLDPGARSLVLDEFLLPEFRSASTGANQWRVLAGFTSSVLNELLAEVWQPFWDAQPDTMLADANSQYPGQDLARRRRRGES